MLGQERKLAAIMFTDIVGYTAMLRKESDKTLELVRQSKQIQQPFVEKHVEKRLEKIGIDIQANFLCSENYIYGSAIKSNIY